MGLFWTNIFFGGFLVSGCAITGFYRMLTMESLTKTKAVHRTFFSFSPSLSFARFTWSKVALNSGKKKMYFILILTTTTLVSLIRCFFEVFFFF